MLLFYPELNVGSLCVQVYGEDVNPALAGLLERASLCHLGLVEEKYSYQTTIYLICTTICTIKFCSGQLQVSVLLWHYPGQFINISHQHGATIFQTGTVEQSVID